MYESCILLLFALMEFYSLREVRRQKKGKMVLPGEILGEQQVIHTHF